jgi:hypothetical protein
MAVNFNLKICWCHLTNKLPSSTEDIKIKFIKMASTLLTPKLMILDRNLGTLTYKALCRTLVA